MSNDAAPTVGNTFGYALSYLQQGLRVQRAGWNGKGQWVALMPAMVVPEGMVNGRTKRFVPAGDLNVGGYLVLMNAQGIWQPGWVPSQGDMFATDWSVIDAMPVSET